MSSRTRIWVLLTVVVCIGVLLIGVVGGLLPQLTAAGGTASLASDTEQRNENMRAHLEQLKDQESRIDDLSDEIEELRRAIPDTAGSADWAREIVELEQASGAVVTLFEVEPPLETAAGASGEPVAPPAEGAEESDEPAVDPAPDTDTAPAAPAGTIVVPFMLTVTGDEAQTVEFVRMLQTGHRLVTVEIIDLHTSGDGWEAIITGVFYVSQR